MIFLMRINTIKSRNPVRPSQIYIINMITYNSPMHIKRIGLYYF